MVMGKIRYRLESSRVDFSLAGEWMTVEDEDESIQGRMSIINWFCILT